MAFGFLCDIFRYNMLQQLRPLKDPNRSSLLSCLFLVMGAGLSIVLNTQTKLGVIGDAMGYAVGMFLAASCLCVRWLPKVNALTAPLSTNRNRFLDSSPVQPATYGTGQYHAPHLLEDRSTSGVRLNYS